MPTHLRGRVRTAGRKNTRGPVWLQAERRSPALKSQMSGRICASAALQHCAVERARGEPLQPQPQDWSPPDSPPWEACPIYSITASC